MGNFSSMDANFRRQREFTEELNRITIERQIQMQNQMRERMAAAQIANAREMFLWLGSFYAVSGIAMVAGFRRTGNPSTLAPLLPLTFIVGYQGDLAYGTKISRVKSEAENILMFERDMIEIPGGLPTVSCLDVGRLKLADEAKYKAVVPPDSSS